MTVKPGLLDLKGSPPRFSGMVGTGGIGHGTFFLLEGAATLGREESRAGRFLDRRDSCKLHIISHGVKLLLGDDLTVYPIGRVGDDEAGRRLCAEMQAVGMDMRFVRSVPGSPTLYSFCFLYPDGSGGNLTTADSASGRVDARAVQEAAPIMAALGAGGIALAVPEVPLAARHAMLELATRYGLFRAASFTRVEMEEVRASRVLGNVDLCALNLEEALAAAEITKEEGSTKDPARLVAGVVESLARRFPRLLLSITAGARGSWAWDGNEIVHAPAVPVKVEGTAGAGDAHFAGLLAGLAAGLAMSDALELGTLFAAASVGSPHTIHPALTTGLLRSVCALRHGLSPRVSALLDNPNGGP